MTTPPLDLEKAIHEQVIAAYLMFADHTDDEDKAREYREKAEALRVANE